MSEKITRTCPICGQQYTEPPALSRRDNKTDICPTCGMMEALAAIPRREEPAERTPAALARAKWLLGITEKEEIEGAYREIDE